MLLLCSNGLSSNSLLEVLRPKLGKSKKAALVVTADREYKEKNYHVPRCVEELERLGLEVRLFDLDREETKQLLEYDVVEFIGGNPFYLLHSIRAHRGEEVLRTLASEKILIGWSAAAFVFGPTLELVNGYSPEMNDVGLTDLSALVLTEVQVLPHYHKFMGRFENFEERCREFEERCGVEVIRLDDGDGVVIGKDKWEVIRK